MSALFHNKVVVVLLFVFFSMFFGGDPGSATTYYVATNGDDSGTGTLSSPWRTVTFAIESSGPGDTVLVRGGTYQESVIMFKGGMRGRRQGHQRQQRQYIPHRGRQSRSRQSLPRSRDRSGRSRFNNESSSSGEYWVLKAYPGEEAIIEGDGPVRIRVPYVRIEGIHFKDSGVGTVGSQSRGGAHHVEIVRNRFSGSGFRYGAISVNGDSILVEGNILEIEEQGGTLDHGIYVHSGKGNIIRNNYISGTEGYGIHVFYQSGRGNRSASIISGLLIEKNIITNSRQRSGIIIATARGKMLIEKIIIRENIIYDNRGNAIDLKPNIRDIEIYNNTIYGNQMGGITLGLMAKMGGAIENVTVKNNIVVINSSDNYHIQSNPEVVKSAVVEHNLFWPGPFQNNKDLEVSGNIVANPKFVNPKAYDFRLGSDSPAKGAGEKLQSASGGAAPDCGAWQITDQNKLDVYLNTFHATPIGNVLKLGWSTVFEEKQVGFEIERSKAGEDSHFEKVGFVQGNGPTVGSQDYQFLDENVGSGTYVYRLKKIDKTGNVEFSPKIEVSVTGKKSETSKDVTQRN